MQMCLFLKLPFPSVLFWTFLFTWNIPEMDQLSPLGTKPGRDLGPALHSNGNQPASTLIFKREWPLLAVWTYVTVLWSSVASSLPSVLTSSVCQSVIVAFEGIIKSLSGVSNLRPARMAMNAAQHKTINSLKTRFFCDHVSQYISCVTQDIRPVWRRDAKRLDTPGSSKV